MVTKNHFYYPSKDGLTKLHAIEWIPQQEIKAVLQISHGMVEYIERYDEFAQYLAEKGYYVIGHDHLGHGMSVADDSRHGYFHETKGKEYIIADIHTLRLRTAGKYPQKPYFMLGHSMGSFLLRQYILLHAQGLSGVVVMGTGHQPAVLLHAGRALCKVISVAKGDTYRSTLVDQMAFGGYNKRFEPARTSKDWLSKDEEKVDRYLADPWCTFMFTVNAYYHLFGGMLELTKKKNMEKIPKDASVFFVAGADDPVGGFGKNVRKVYEKYKAAGIRDVSLRLYETDRHEILNETDRQVVYEELFDWLEERL